MRVIAYDANDLVEQSVTEVAELDAFKDRVVWLDVVGLGSVDLLRELSQKFQLHPLAVEDVFDTGQRPKFEGYEAHDFIVMRQMAFKDQLDIEQVSMFIGPGFVITVQEHTGDSFEPVRDRLRRSSGRIRARGADYLGYALLDALVDNFVPVLELLGEELERVENEILAGRESGVLLEVHEVRRALYAARRACLPLHEAIRDLLKPDASRFLDETRVFLRDTQDHAVQAMDMVAHLRDLSSGLMELSVSQAGQRMNEIMKVLTIISTLFIPLSFIAGVYGMNFDTGKTGNMPELGLPYAYPTVIGVMVLVDLVFLAYFWRQGWIGLPWRSTRGRLAQRSGASASVSGGQSAETG